MSFGDISVKRYFSLCAVVIGLVFALIDDMPGTFVGALIHVVQWQFQVIIPMVCLYLVHSALLRLSAFRNFGPWVQLVLTALIASLAFVPAALCIDVILGKGNENFSVKGIVDEYVAVLPSALVCWLAINAPWVTGYRLTQVGPKSITASPGKAIPAFMSQMPADQLGELIYLEAELHYLKVVTTDAKNLILYSLRDAIAELPKEIGIQTHRSYWVSLAYIDKFKRVGRQGELILRNGEIIPVSRRNLSEVEQAYLRSRKK